MKKTSFLLAVTNFCWNVVQSWSKPTILDKMQSIKDNWKMKMNYIVQLDYLFSKLPWSFVNLSNCGIWVTTHALTRAAQKCSFRSLCFVERQRIPFHCPLPPLSHKAINVENHIKTYMRKTESSHFSNIRTKTERPAHAVEHSNKVWAPPVLKMSFQTSAFTKVEHTKLKPYVVKIPRTDCLWCNKKILEMRPPKTGWDFQNLPWPIKRAQGEPQSDSLDPGPD